jgi:hypothetical protein
MRSAALAKSCLAIAARVCPALNALPSNLNVRLQLQAALLAGRKLSQKSLVPPKAFPLPQSYTKAGNAQ